MDQRTRRSPARFLAPLALIAVLVVFLAIVTASGGDGGDAGSSTTEARTTPGAKSTTTKKKSTRAKTKKKAATKKETYRVQVGDTLGGIADKTGVPLERIEELNPNIDPHTLNAGQEIRLK
jgi:LysM repeat protein